ncbi:vacuolar sorting protein 9 domain protein, partial [Ancylostoma ceylanicum]
LCSQVSLNFRFITPHLISTPVTLHNYRCCETISNLISMAPGTGAAAADDITPVLVYVIIQANPPSLLSNVQYVQGFGGSLLEGAEGYWWTQFTAAIEFVKTLL